MRSFSFEEDRSSRGEAVPREERNTDEVQDTSRSHFGGSESQETVSTSTEAAVGREVDEVAVLSLKLETFAGEDFGRWPGDAVQRRDLR